MLLMLLTLVVLKMPVALAMLLRLKLYPIANWAVRAEDHAAEAGVDAAVGVVKFQPGRPARVADVQVPAGWRW